MEAKLRNFKTGFKNSGKNLLMNDIFEERLSLCVLLVLLAVVTLFNYKYNLAYITSDSIANIRYVQYVWETHSLFPDFWTGSTGLMLPALLPGLPVYAITGDLVITHGATNIINQFLVMLAFYYMLKSFGFTKKDIYFACIIMLVSLVCAAQAVLVIISYTAYSSIFITAFLSVGFMNKLRKGDTVRFRKSKIVLLFIAAFVLGICTPQFFMTVFAPLVAYNTYYLIKNKTKQEFKYTAMSAALFAVSLAAYFISLKMIMPNVGVPGMWSATLVNNPSVFIETILHELDIAYYIFSYVGGASLFSKQGIYSLLILLYYIVFIACLIWSLKKSKTDHKGMIIYFGMSVVFVYLYLSFIVMPFAVRYFAFLPLLMALAVVVVIDSINKELLKKIFKIAAAVGFLVIFLIFSLCHMSENHEKNRQVDTLKKVSNYLQEENCDTAFATFWNANRLTGVTDDVIKTGSINLDLSIFNWLLDRRVFASENSDKPTAIILTDSELDAMKEQNDGKLNAKLDFAYETHEIDDLNIFMFDRAPVQIFEMPKEVGEVKINKVGKTLILRNGEIDADYNYTVAGQGDYNMFGPHITIKDGTYRVEVSYEVVSSSKTGSPGVFDISENSGSIIRTQTELDKNKQVMAIDNVTFDHAHEVEFRVIVNNGFTVILKNVTVTRIQ